MDWQMSLAVRLPRGKSPGQTSPRLVLHGPLLVQISRMPWHCHAMRWLRQGHEEDGTDFCNEAWDAHGQMFSRHWQGRRHDMVTGLSRLRLHWSTAGVW